MTAREKIERAFHVSFKLPEQAAELLNDYRQENRTEMMDEILEITEGTEVQWVGRLIERKLGIQGTVRAI